MDEMRIRKSTEHEKSCQLKIVRANLPRNMSAYEHIDLDAAKSRAKEQLAKLLKRSQPNKFFTAQENNTVVGYLWLVEEKEDTFVAYLHVLSRFRRKGYGQKMIQWAEARASRQGAKRLSLHVFANNRAAIALYEKCGFVQSNIRMLKPITPSDTC